jgi:benzoyl-CoA reductase/2-hydroxyglutaryl-CoA dehydratase subunit BcrC/BadD/HgdB
VTAPVRDGLVHRLRELSDIISALPETLSDAEARGVERVLPPHTRRAVHAALAPHIRPASLPFLKLMASWLKEVSAATAAGRKVILIPFNFPPEVIHVFRRAVPLTCEVLTTLGVGVLEGYGERYWDEAMALGLPDYLCSSSTIELGSILSGRDLRPDAIVQSTAGACDANSKVHEFVSLHLGIPQLFIEKPADNSPRGRAQHRRYFRRFIAELEQLLDEPLDEAHMREVLEQGNRATDLYYDLYDLHRPSPCPVPNLLSLYSYGVRFTSWGRPEAVEVLQRMVELSADRLQRGAYPAPAEVARTLWIYVGYYFDLWGLFNWMEERGITYLHDLLSLYVPRPVDTTSKATMLDGLADAVFDYPMTRQMGGSSMSLGWIEDTEHFIRDLNASCAIFSGHHACKQTWSVFATVKREITRRTGVPVLALQGDSWSPRTTSGKQLRDEITGFVDTVVARRAGRRRRGRRSRRQRTGEEG